MSNQNYKIYTVRSAAILTNSTVPGSVIGASATTAENKDVALYANDQMIILADFTKGSLTNAIITVEFSPDGSTWYQETYDEVTASTGVVTEHPVTRVMAATGKFRLPIPILDQNIRISAIGTGDVTGSSLAIKAIIGNH